MLSPLVRQLHSPSSHADSLSLLQPSLFHFNSQMHPSHTPSLPSPSATATPTLPHPPPPQSAPAPDSSSVDFRTFYPYTPNEVKHRKRTSRAQLKVLEEHFRRDTKPNAAIRKVLADQLGMSIRGVQVWFQNRRAKEKALATKAASARRPKPLPQPVPHSPTATDLDHHHHHGQHPHHYDRSSHSPAVLDLFPELPAASTGNPPEFADTSSESSPINTHPPSLHLGPFGPASAPVADSCPTPWQNSPSADNTVFIVSPGDHDPFESQHVGFRRGSLPSCYPQPTDYPYLLADGPDALGRRRSVDNSLIRLASHPYAHFALAKNGALYGGVGRYSPPPAPPSSSSFQPQHVGRAFPHSRPRLAQSLSPVEGRQQHQQHFYDYSGPHTSSSLPPQPPPIITSSSYPNHTAAAARPTLSPDGHQHVLSSRIVSAPLPGPLPSPNYSFGAAVAGTSPSPQIPSPVESDPADSIAFVFQNRIPRQGHLFPRPRGPRPGQGQPQPGDDPDTEDDGTSGSYGGYSRFGSMVSLAGSESSNTSAYYSEVGSCVAAATGATTDGHRGTSPNGGGFLNLMSGLEVNSSNGSLSEAHVNVSNAELDLEHNNTSNDTGDHGDVPTSPYSSPSSTVSPCHQEGPNALMYAIQQEHQRQQQAASAGDSTSMNVNVNDGSPAHAQHPVPFYYVPREESGPAEVGSGSGVETRASESMVLPVMDFSADKFSFDGEISVMSPSGHYHQHHHPGMPSTADVYAAYGAAAAVAPATVNPSFLA